MAAEVVQEEVVQEKEGHVYGNFYTENIVLPDLEIGPESTRQAFKLEPGEVVDLGKYFSDEDLSRSLSLDLALQNEWLKPCELGTKIEVPEHRLGPGIAPPNVFDRKLKAELLKERAEEERMKAGRDGLAARVMDLDLEEGKK